MQASGIERPAKEPKSNMTTMATDGIKEIAATPAATPPHRLGFAYLDYLAGGNPGGHCPRCQVGWVEAAGLTPVASDADGHAVAVCPGCLDREHPALLQAWRLAQAALRLAVDGAVTPEAATAAKRARLVRLRGEAVAAATPTEELPRLLPWGTDAAALAEQLAAEGAARATRLDDLERALTGQLGLAADDGASWLDLLAFEAAPPEDRPGLAALARARLARRHALEAETGVPAPAVGGADEHWPHLVPEHHDRYVEGQLCAVLARDPRPEGAALLEAVVERCERALDLPDAARALERAAAAGLVTLTDADREAVAALPRR